VVVDVDLNASGDVVDRGRGSLTLTWSLTWSSTLT
jgi:hypothetical protein